MISIQHLHKSYNKGKQNAVHVIKDISLELPEKGITAIFGRSGCGKTTLLNLMGGLDDYESGTLEVKGESIRRNTDQLRNEHIGYIFQNYNLNKTESVFENVADALRLIGMKEGPELNERVEAALAAVGMERYKKRRPLMLSGGQQQRVAIARAIVKDPAIILADEPTGNLDEANTIQIMNLLREIAKEHLVVLVTHEASLVDYYCDTVVELQDGKVHSIRHNDNAAGYQGVSRNDIYLGELPQTRLEHQYAVLNYYGDAPQEPLSITLVNKDGKTYLALSSDKIQLLSEESEIRLKEGAPEPRKEEAKDQDAAFTALFEMEKPAVGVCGRLFDWKNSWKSGRDAISAKKTKGAKLLRGVMILFAMVFVFMVATFGTSIQAILEAKEKRSEKMYYLRLGGMEDVEKLEALKEEGSVFDDIRFDSSYPSGYFNRYEDRFMLESFAFSLAQFETNIATLDTLPAHGNALERTALPDNAKLLTGSLDWDGIVITRPVADELLKNSTTEYIKAYPDLLGLSLDVSPRMKSYSITAVIEGEEKLIYLPEALMSFCLKEQNLSQAVIFPASQLNDSRVQPGKGEIIQVLNLEYDASDWETDNLAQAGDILEISGVNYTVKDSQSLKYEKKLGIWPDYMSQYKAFFMNDEDYAAAVRRIGNTRSLVLSQWYSSSGGTIIVDYNKQQVYAIIHAVDTEKAEQTIRDLLPQLKPLEKGGNRLTTPLDTLKMALQQNSTKIRNGLLSMLLMLLILCLCMRFIMRASLMSRVKEIGIYRAIGVSKKNLVFRFFVETLVLICFTMGIGYLLSSLILRYLLGHSVLIGQIFYYPLWLMLLTGLILAGTSAFFGIMPLLTLLRKTPSEILAEYDI